MSFKDKLQYLLLKHGASAKVDDFKDLLDALDACHRESVLELPSMQSRRYDYTCNQLRGQIRKELDER